MSDLIKREDAIEVAYQLRRKPNDDEWDWWLRSFNAIPSADIDLSEYSDKLWRNAYERGKADRPQGEWIEQEDDYHHYWECSECGMGVGLDDIRNYCPSCGARMKGADDEQVDMHR